MHVGFNYNLKIDHDIYMHIYVRTRVYFLYIINYNILHVCTYICIALIFFPINESLLNFLIIIKYAYVRSYVFGTYVRAFQKRSKLIKL